MQNTIEIGGQLWHSKKSLMAQLGIEKSLFYERVNDGTILTRQVFPDSYFRVYKINESADD